jgi:hypothetical protein
MAFGSTFAYAWLRKNPRVSTPCGPQQLSSRTYFIIDSPSTSGLSPFPLVFSPERVLAVSSKRYLPFLKSTVDTTVLPLVVRATSSAVEGRNPDHAVRTVGVDIEVA